jgi:hypothetical protein
MTALLSGSGMARAKHCPPAYALPVVEEPPSQECSDGTHGHRFLQRIAQGAHVDQALYEAPDHLRKYFATLDLSKVPRGEPEVAFAYDVATGQARFLNHRGHRNYEVSDTEIPGTADLVVWPIDDKSLKVIDWKFPSFDHDVEGSWPQMEFYALPLSILCGVHRAELLLGIVNEDGSIGFHERRLDWEDLARVSNETHSTHERVMFARADRELHEQTHQGPWLPDVVTGAHCQYCKAFPHCPGKRAAVAGFLGTVPEVLGPEEAGRAYLASKAAERLGKAVHGVVRNLLEQHDSLPTGDGQVVRFARDKSIRIARPKEKRA